jgi:hypothetical protein
LGSEVSGFAPTNFYRGKSIHPSASIRGTHARRPSCFTHRRLAVPDATAASHAPNSSTITRDDTSSKRLTRFSGNDFKASGISIKQFRLPFALATSAASFSAALKCSYAKKHA